MISFFIFPCFSGPNLKKKSSKDIFGEKHFEIYEDGCIAEHHLNE